MCRHEPGPPQDVDVAAHRRLADTEMTGDELEAHTLYRWIGGVLMPEMLIRTVEQSQDFDPRLVGERLYLILSVLHSIQHFAM